MRAVRHFKLDEGSQERSMRFVCDLEGLRLGEGVKTATVTITRTGRFTDPRYGTFDITREMLLGMVRNFDANTYGQEVFIDVNHEPGKGAAAKVVRLSVDGNRLRADVEFTPYGIDAVKTKGFKYLSAEFVDDYVDNEQGKSHGPTLLGAALTTRPVIKRLDPVVLAESAGNVPVFLHPELVRKLSHSLEQTTMKWLEELKRRLAQRKLAQSTVDSLIKAYEPIAKTLGEDDKQHEQLVAQFDDAAKQLAEAGKSDAPVTITIAAPGAAAKTLSEDDVKKLLADERKKVEDDTRKLAETKAARVKTFTEAVDAAKGLSDGTKAELKKAQDLITADVTDDQAKRLAETQISLGNQIEAARQLSGLGFTRSGTPHITVDETNTIKKLALDVRAGLKRTQMAEMGRIRVIEDGKESAFVQRMLAEFDAQNAHRLHAEAKMLAGSVNVGNMTALPASYEREVIAQIYQDLAIMQLINASVDPTKSATHNIEYETRDTSAVTGGAITAEGAPIQQAGVSLLNAIAYINQRKLALEITNEAIWFSRNNAAVNWDAWARNIASNAQVMRELVATDVANRMQRDSDAFSVVTVPAATATTAFTLATNGYKTANFPVVQPYQARDLQGNAVGAVENPVTIKDGATVLAEFDGTGTQSGANKYFRWLSYNLGLFQIVDNTGAPTAPAGAVTAGYDYTTNVYSIDTDIAGGSTYEKQMNKLVQSVGNRKAALRDRFVSPDFLLLSATLHNMATDAEIFSQQFKRPDSDINAAGDLQPIKMISAYSTNAPGINLGDERILMGARANFWYTVAKVFAIGEPVERVDSNGKFLGKKGAYGEEYASLLVPKPLRARYTSVLAYSHTNARGA